LTRSADRDVEADVEVSVSDLVYNPFTWDIQHNPFPTYRRLRDEAPVYHNPEVGFYALSRYEDILRAHLEPLTYISSMGNTLETTGSGEVLVTIDPPDHDWHRNIVSRLFTPRQTARLESFVRQTAADLLDRYRTGGRFDVVEDFSISLPLRVISHLLGVPEGMRPDVHALADRLFTREDESGAVSADAASAMAELTRILTALVMDRRSHMGDDVVSLMIGAEVPDGDGTRRLTDREVSIRTLELAFAGHETVARLIANGIVALSWWPEQRAELVADPSLIPVAVEEMLRWDPPSHYQGRWTARDVELHHTTIPKDSRVILLTGSAGHDERVYPDPEVFDFRRKGERPVYFGFGPHFCLGAALARLEARVAFEEFLARFPYFDLDEAGIVRMRSSNVRGLARLPVIIPPAA
jgi:cytochrome P450